MYTRFAIYFCPEPTTKLAEFGRDWLGWDIDAGDTVPQPSFAGFDLKTVTERPQKYGFHGTIKAPFRLLEGADLATLQTMADRFAKRSKSFEIPALHVSKIGQFLAITEVEPCLHLRNMAAEAVRFFEPCRAELTEEDLIRRRKSKLTPTQDALLVKWGYPYVFDAFQFHLTLSGPLDSETQTRVKDAAESMLGDTLATAQPCNSISVCAERADGRFIRLSRHVFSA
ncbi:MAG: DUF1045 domain-containing protein [Pseudomonadota bacterium]